MSAPEPPASAPQRKVLFDDPPLNRVVEMVVALGGELAAALDEIDTLRRLLVQGGVLTAEALASYRADPAAEEEREARRLRLLRTLFSSLDGEFGRPKVPEPPPATPSSPV